MIYSALYLYFVFCAWSINFYYTIQYIQSKTKDCNAMQYNNIKLYMDVLLIGMPLKKYLLSQ